MSIATRIETNDTVTADRSTLHSQPIAIVIPEGTRLQTNSADFERLAAANRDLRLEMSGSGDLIVMAPEGSVTGNRNFEISVMLGIWVRTHGGVGFGSSAGFTLPNGAIRAPDVAWISADRWQGLSDSDKSGFARIAPDFVIELRSPSDKIEDCREKMAEYAAVGVRLGWLIDPEAKTVTVYRPGQDPKIVENPERVSGEDVLPGFELETRPIFSG
ncbi:Uma2 family endonuclease [bacterium]|nr:Uma2 family endonuclease [bacterium]